MPCYDIGMGNTEKMRMFALQDQFQGDADNVGSEYQINVVFRW